MFDFLGRRRTAMLATSAVAIVGSMSTAWAQEQARAFDIHAQRLSSALLEYSRQSDMLVVADPALVNGKNAPAVHGTFTPSEALDRLLAGSGLTPQRRADGGIVLAQSSASPTGLDAADRTASREAAVEEEIVVTGTNIRGVNPTSPVITIDRDAIDRTGYSSTQQLFESLPQNFAGGDLGASEDGFIGPGGGAQSNISSATGVNLRGLGTNATLVLLNGRRVAQSALGQAVDISLIPLNAIERVEVLTDGSSAIYGADAVAGVVNFVLRRYYEGAESRVRYGSTTDGSVGEWLASQAFGRTWTGGGALLSAQYRHRDFLPASERAFSQNAEQPNDFLPEVDEFSGVFSINQQLTPSLDFFSDILFAHKASERFFTQFGQTQLFAPETISITGSVGFGYDLTSNWRLETAASFSNEQTDLYLSYFPPVPFHINGERAVSSDFLTWSADAKIDGPLFHLPGGDVRAAFGASYREEEFSQLLTEVGASRKRTFAREVAAAFGEIYAPLVGGSNRFPLVEEFDVSAAVRYDDYSDFGGTTNPRIGIRWSPIAGLDARASYSTSFRAPNAQELFSSQAGFDSIVLLTADVFPQPGGGTAPVFLLCCSLPDLDPETSTNYTGGLDYQPEFSPGTHISLNYYNIDFRDRIITPPFDPATLLRSDVYGSLITNLADDDAAQAFLDDFLALGYDFIDAFGLGTGAAGVRFAIDNRQQNVAVVEIEGYDLGVEHEFDLGPGVLGVGLNATIIEHVLTAFTDSSTPTDVVGTYANPVGFRLRSDVSWRSDAWTINVAANYLESYDDTTIIPAGSIDAWTTVDLNFSYSPEYLDGAAIRLSVQNAFDAEPPRVASDLNQIGYDPANADPLGRFIALEIRKQW